MQKKNLEQDRHRGGTGKQAGEQGRSYFDDFLQLFSGFVPPSLSTTHPFRTLGSLWPKVWVWIGMNEIYVPHLPKSCF